MLYTSAYMPQQVQLNTDKCKVISIHHQKYSNTGVEPHYILNSSSLEEVEVKDLGVYYDSLLLFDNHATEQVKRSHNAVTKRNIIYISVLSV